MLDRWCLSDSLILNDNGREGAGDEKADDEFSYASNLKFSVRASNANFSWSKRSCSEIEYLRLAEEDDHLCDRNCWRLRDFLVSSSESKQISGELDLDIDVASDEDEYWDEEKTLLVRRWVGLILSGRENIRLDPVELFLQRRTVDGSSDRRLSIDEVENEEEVGDDKVVVLSERLIGKMLGFQERRVGWAYMCSWDIMSGVEKRKKKSERSRIKKRYKFYKTK